MSTKSDALVWNHKWPAHWHNNNTSFGQPIRHNAPSIPLHGTTRRSVRHGLFCEQLKTQKSKCNIIHVLTPTVWKTQWFEGNTMPMIGLRVANLAAHRFRKKISLYVKTHAQRPLGPLLFKVSLHLFFWSPVAWTSSMDLLFDKVHVRAVNLLHLPHGNCHCHCHSTRMSSNDLTLEDVLPELLLQGIFGVLPLWVLDQGDSVEPSCLRHRELWKQVVCGWHCSWLLDASWHWHWHWPFAHPSGSAPCPQRSHRHEEFSQFHFRPGELVLHFAHAIGEKHSPIQTPVASLGEPCIPRHAHLKGHPHEFIVNQHDIFNAPDTNVDPLHKNGACSLATWAATSYSVPFHWEKAW